ncbi:MAG: 16S rRNA (cytosine(967)-C(5))-methyltransferase RsmB [Christensenellales bacterium]|jgi:16S rRNA (cytosine967-C5)-methyltransferase
MNKSARKTAYDALCDILDEGKYSNLALKERLNAARLSRRDKSFATRLVYGVLDEYLKLEYYIGELTKGQRVHKKIRKILLLGFYEISVLENAYGATNEYVSLAKAIGKPMLAGFVNGVLRRFCERKDDIELPRSTAWEALSYEYSWPLWILEYWGRYYDEQSIKNMLEGFRTKKHGVHIRPNLLNMDTEAFKAYLNDRGIAWKETASPYCFETTFHDFEDADFQCGVFSVQNAGSCLAACAVTPEAGQRILDVCAAPGGKSAMIAELMRNEGQIIACELHSHRTELIRRNMQRLGIRIVDAQTRDMRERIPSFTSRFDAVLLDAPCSGLGVMGKSDIRYKLSMGEIESLQALQQQLLRSAAQYVSPGGILVYSTCTVSPLENEEVLDAFLREQGGLFQTDDTYELHAGHRGVLQMMPHTHGEGFFIARMRRTS